MAKDTDHLADGFDTEDTGGLFSNLLADEDTLDRRALWRIGSWGVGAVGAVILAVMANQSSLGLKRDQTAAAELTRQAQQIQQATKETRNETRRLASAVDTLNSDRDRLYTRVTSLEQGLDSVTGAITRQASAGAVPPASPFVTADRHAGQGSVPAVSPVTTQPVGAAAPEKPATKASTAEPAQATISAAAKEPAKAEAKADTAKADAPKIEIAKTESSKPATAKVESAKPPVAKPATAKVETVKAENVRTEVAKADPVAADLPKIGSATTDRAKADTARNEGAKSDAAKPDGSKPDVAGTPAASPATPLVAAKSLMAPPDPSASRLIEPDKPVSPVAAAPIPEVVASAPTATDEEPDEATSPRVALRRTEFGVDLGTAHSVGGLRALWRGLLKSRSNAPLTALRPIIVIKERPHGRGMQLRLVAGPLNDAGDAAKICAVLAENKRACETTVFDGQRLSLEADDPPKATTRPASRKHGTPKHSSAAAVPAEEPPKKPETPTLSSSISSMFSRITSQ